MDSKNFKPILTCIYTNCKHASYLFNADTLTLNNSAAISSAMMTMTMTLVSQSVNQSVNQLLVLEVI